MSDCKEVSTPIECNINLNKDNSCCRSYPYQQLVGSLMYVAMLTRPDIAFSVSYMSQFNNCFGKTHFEYLKRILKYLKCTKSYGLKFTNNDEDLIGYVDADWAGDRLDRKSYTGFVFKLSGSVIS